MESFLPVLPLFEFGLLKYVEEIFSTNMVAFRNLMGEGSFVIRDACAKTDV